MSEDGFGGIVITFIITAIVCGAQSCSIGYKWGYDAHRADVCGRSGGTWVQQVADDSKRTCIHGGRR